MCVSMLPAYAFADGDHQITVNGGKASLSSAQADTTVEVSTVVPPEGKVFSGWTANPSVTFTDPTSTSTTFTMPDNDITVTANYEAAPITHSITISGGTASSTTAQANTSVSVTADVPPEGKVFSGWTSNPSVAFEDATATSTTFAMPNEDVTVTAIFRNVATTFSVASRGSEVKSGNDTGPFTVTVEGGSTETPSVSPGVKVTITATPEGRTFQNWTSEDGVIFDDDDAETTFFIMPDHNVTVKANYAASTIKYKISIKEGTSTPATEAAPGTRVDVEAATNQTGKVFKEWISDEAGPVTFDDRTSETTCFTMPDHDVIIEAVFVEEAYKITVKGGTSKPQDKAAEGVTVTVTATIPDGKAFKEWTSKTAGVSFKDATASQTTFKMPKKDVEIEATFKDLYKITIKPAPVNGTVSVDKDTAAKGETIKISVKPNFGYLLNTLKVVNKETSQTISVKDTQFKMPDADVVVSATFKAVRIVKGDGGTAHYGSPYSFALNTDFDDIDVAIDGVSISYPDQYRADYDNGTVTLRRTFISSSYLTEGKHRITISTNFGNANGTFWVSKSPKTGDDSNVALWVTVGVISAAGAAGIAYYLLKKRKK